jgi:serine/threonine-protein kinase
MNVVSDRILKNGKYVLGAKLGGGVFGITYRANDPESGQTVAIKTITPSLRHNPHFQEFKQQFLSLSRRFAEIKHPNLVRVRDVFEEANLPYMVMDYVPGQTLASLIQSSPLSEAEAVHYIQQIGSALSIVHKAGLRHGDVKPQNMIRRVRTHEVVLTDFDMMGELRDVFADAGLLKFVPSPSEKYITQENTSLERDIYALAATFYWLLRGQTPPLAEGVAGWSAKGNGASASLRDRVPLAEDLRKFQPNLSPDVEHAVCVGLNIEADQRPQNVEGWLALLPPSTNQKGAGTLARPIVTLPVLAWSAETLPTNGPAEPAVENSVMGMQEELPNLENEADKPQLAGGSKSSASVKLGLFLKPMLQAKNSPQVRSLMMTAAVAATLGAGFGLALRINSPTDPGSTFLHAEQSFPPRSDWPVTDTQTSIIKSQNAVVQSQTKPVSPAKPVVTSQKSVAPRQEEPVRRRRRAVVQESAAQNQERPVRRRRRAVVQESAAQNQERPVRRRRRAVVQESAAQNQERPVRRRRRAVVQESAAQNQERPVRRRRRVNFQQSEESSVGRSSTRVRRRSSRRSQEVSQDSSVSNRQPRVRSRRYKQRPQSE